MTVDERDEAGVEPVRPPRTIAPPARRDAGWFAPLIILSPARSNSTVVAAMIGMHPELYGFPELALFRKEYVRQLLSDPAGWRGAPARLRLAGVLRSLARLNDGEETDETIASATVWLQERATWRVEHVFDHLLAAVSPRIGVEKSPETASRDDFLERALVAYPRARFLHLTRHPLTSIDSMHRSWHELGYWDIEPALFRHFCVGVWFFSHRRIDRLLSRLPPDRGLQLRSEDVLNSPRETLPRLCKWLGIDAGADAIDAMSHPELATYARFGPDSARGGGDSSFLDDPVPRAAPLPERLEFPQDWQVDPWQAVSAIELARKFGYGVAA